MTTDEKVKAALNRKLSEIRLRIKEEREQAFRHTETSISEFEDLNNFHKIHIAIKYQEQNFIKSVFTALESSFAFPCNRQDVEGCWNEVYSIFKAMIIKRNSIALHSYGAIDLLTQKAERDAMSYVIDILGHLLIKLEGISIYRIDEGLRETLSL